MCCTTGAQWNHPHSSPLGMEIFPLNQRGFRAEPWKNGKRLWLIKPEVIVCSTAPQSSSCQRKLLPPPVGHPTGCHPTHTSAACATGWRQLLFPWCWNKPGCGERAHSNVLSLPWAQAAAVEHITLPLVWETFTACYKRFGDGLLCNSSRWLKTNLNIRNVLAFFFFLHVVNTLRNGMGPY